jgi:hypothetical protein
LTCKKKEHGAEVGFDGSLEVQEVELRGQAGSEGLGLRQQQEFKLTQEEGQELGYIHFRYFSFPKITLIFLAMNCYFEVGFVIS